jgi:urease subunit beta
MKTQNEPGYAPMDYAPVGGVILKEADIEYNVGRATRKVTVRNTGDRPIQVGSHFHFFEVNRYLDFNRMQAFGYHLNIPATTAIRFEPGDEKEVELVSYGGKTRVIGFNGLVKGYTGREEVPEYYPTRIRAKRRLKHRGFKNECHCTDNCNCGEDCNCGDDCNCNTEKP